MQLDFCNKEDYIDKRKGEFSMDIIELNPESFKAILLKPAALIDFYAPWCGPCRNMARELEKFAADHPEIAIGKVNIESEENKELAATFDVSTIPSIFFFRNGQLVKHVTGFFSRTALADELLRQ
ncbi:MAG: thioredoxin family protein [Lentisphaerae bacterium]|nr:thioredoxin family protein [Lentisphaerota bacterium]